MYYTYKYPNDPKHVKLIYVVPKIIYFIKAILQVVTQFSRVFGLPGFFGNQ